MKTWRQQSTALAAVLLIVDAGCSSGDSDNGPTAPGGEQATGEVGALTMDPNFETDGLPDDFPSELIPDSYTAGMYAELGSVRNVNFESPAAFDDVVAEYSGKIGEEPIIVQGEERLASWTVDIWVVSVIESEPIVIGVSTSD